MISYLQVDNLSKRFGEQLLFENISFGIGKGQKVALIAKNGMGKSTLLRIIAGKDTSESGTVIFRNDITLGILDQDPALDPENSVFEEVFHSDSPVLKLIKAYEEAVAHNHTEALEKLIPEMDIHSAWDYDTTIKQILSELKIDTYDKKIGQLSGGQKQRVAIARALAAKTHYLLCDEATSALDPDTTRSVLELLKKINRTLGVTIIVITHEMKVIDSICDRVAVLDNSTVAEIGDVRTVFANPKSDIAKKLIMPQGELPVTSEHGKKIRIIYNGENSSKSLLSDMILKCSTPVNILHADTKDIDGKAYGQILVQLPDNDTSAEKITAYLKANNVTYSQV